MCGYKRWQILWREKAPERRGGIDRNKLLNKVKEQGNGKGKEARGRRLKLDEVKRDIPEQGHY